MYGRIPISTYMCIYVCMYIYIYIYVNIHYLSTPHTNENLLSAPKYAHRCIVNF